MTIYAKQIPPEHQESPLWIDGFWDGSCPVIVTSGGHVRTDGYDWESEHADLYRRIVDCYDEMCNEYYNNFPDGTYKNATELCKDYLYGFDIKWSTQRIGRIKKCLEKYNTKDYYDGIVYAEMLEILTGLKWGCATIKGICQGDWAEILYVHGELDVQDFEELFFNTGTEWMIHDEDTDVKCPEDVNGHCMYITKVWRDEDVKNYIRKHGIRSSDEEVVLYIHDGYDKVSRYTVA